MQVIARGQSNSMVVTLQEKQTLTNPYWLVRFVNESSLVENSCISPDTSSYTSRYNKLTVRESTSEDRVNGTLYLPEGIYTYYVYEQASSSNLDFRNAGTMCEVGQVRVTAVNEQVISFPTITTEYKWTNQ